MSFVWAYGCPLIPACALYCGEGVFAVPHFLAPTEHCPACCPLLRGGSKSIIRESHHLPVISPETTVGLLRHPAARAVSAFHYGLHAEGLLGSQRCALREAVSNASGCFHNSSNGFTCDRPHTDRM